MEFAVNSPWHQMAEVGVNRKQETLLSSRASVRLATNNELKTLKKLLDQALEPIYVNRNLECRLVGYRRI